MSEIEYVSLHRVNSECFLPILNDQAVRKHLIDHVRFDSGSIQEWVNEKADIDAMPGCRIRAVYIDDVLAGWCGIQPDESEFEIAIVLSKQYWGFGISVFKALMCWAKEWGHKKILFHLLETRREYKFLKRMAFKVRKTELMGQSFTTYFIAVNEWKWK